MGFSQLPGWAPLGLKLKERTATCRWGKAYRHFLVFLTEGWLEPAVSAAFHSFRPLVAGLRGGRSAGGGGLMGSYGPELRCQPSRSAGDPGAGRHRTGSVPDAAVADRLLPRPRPPGGVGWGVAGLQVQRGGFGPPPPCRVRRGAPHEVCLSLFVCFQGLAFNAPLPLPLPHVWADGLARSDPHPGNLIRMADQSKGRLALLDCGLMARLNEC